MLFHQRDAQPAGRRVERDAGAGDAAADHDDVDAGAVGELAQLGGAAGSVEAGEVGHHERYPFSEWASSRASASASRIGRTIWADWIVDWVISRHHRGQLARVAGAHAAVPLAGSQFARRPRR